jgi:hypothetical protein
MKLKRILKESQEFKSTYFPSKVHKIFYAALMKMLKDGTIRVPGLESGDEAAWADTVATWMFKEPFPKAIEKY